MFININAECMCILQCQNICFTNPIIVEISSASLFHVCNVYVCIIAWIYIYNLKFYNILYVCELHFTQSYQNIVITNFTNVAIIQSCIECTCILTMRFYVMFIYFMLIPKMCY